MRRYEHGGDVYGNPEVSLDFSVNTNPLGMPKEVRQALVSRVDEFARYPDPLCRELRAAIARSEGVPEDFVLCGNGAADLIYRLCRAIRPRAALVCAPTFSEYERALGQVGCHVSYHALRPERLFELTQELAESLLPGIDLLFLCNPNNPTGRLISSDVLELVLRRAAANRTAVVVDECFLDFTRGASAKSLLAEIPGLIVLKAFTKMYAMAGLRLGYMLTADRGLLDKTGGAAQCWSVSVPAQIAGMAALSCEGWPEKTRRLVSRERKFLSGSFGELGITAFPGDANFLLLRCDTPLCGPLLKKGILTRPCDNFAGLDASYLRVCVKTRSENLRLIQAVKEIING